MYMESFKTIELQKDGKLMLYNLTTHTEIERNL